jgi:hypothetical protein
MKTLRIVWLGFVLAVGTGIAYLVWSKLKVRFAEKKGKKITGSDGREPGMIGNLLKTIGGVFTGGKSEADAPIAGPYGRVGTPNFHTGGGYTFAPVDARVPSFLEGATGGVQDDKMIGKAPPPNLGGPPPVGSGIYSPEWNDCQPKVAVIQAYDAKDFPN